MRREVGCVGRSIRKLERRSPGHPPKALRSRVRWRRASPAGVTQPGVTAPSLPAKRRPEWMHAAGRSAAHLTFPRARLSIARDVTGSHGRHLDAELSGAGETRASLTVPVTKE
jgi:hypothetical protein